MPAGAVTDMAVAALGSPPGLIAAALLIEAATGYPSALYRLVRHPVVWIGALIAWLDRTLNQPSMSAATRRAAGVAAMLIVVGVVAGVATAISRLLPDTLPGFLAEAVLASTLLAQRSLADHVAAVSRPLLSGDVAAARVELAKIVGRDVRALEPPAIARAATESLSENFSDGVIAPALWGAVLGLPGLAAYKAINTLDSMIGRRTPRHEAFGWASARLDDIVNLVPARLAALLLAVAAWRRAPQALAAALRDASRHRSPNAGWPEAAMAGALGVRLSGPRIYAGRVADEPWLNAAGRDPDAADITRGLRLYATASAIFILGLAATAWAMAR
jgi:adenosylcobinamide-phosphate synthase